MVPRLEIIEFAFELFDVLEYSLGKGGSFFRRKRAGISQRLIAFPNLVAHSRSFEQIQEGRDLGVDYVTGCHLQALALVGSKVAQEELAQRDAKFPGPTLEVDLLRWIEEWEDFPDCHVSSDLHSVLLPTSATSGTDHRR